MKKKFVIVALVVVACLAVAVAFVFFGGSQQARHGRTGGSRQGQYGPPGNWTHSWNQSAYANNTEVQGLFKELQTARSTGDQNLVNNITLQLEKLGVNMSARARFPPGFSPGSTN